MRLENPQIEEIAELEPSHAVSGPTQRDEKAISADTAGEILTVLSHNESWPEIFTICQTPYDFKKLFNGMGISGNQWKNSTWLTKKAKLPMEKGGINKSLKGLYKAIIKRFGGLPQFVAWMEGKEKPEETLAGKINGYASREDFLRLFDEMGIPENKWKNSTWLGDKAKLPENQGGIGKNLGGLLGILKKRFKGFSRFVAWMEGKEKPDETWNEKIDGCKDPQDFLALFKDIGIPHDKWKNSVWLKSKSKLTPVKGGIERNLGGLLVAIERKFKGFLKFVSWMDGKEIIHKKWRTKIDKCKTPDDFLKLFKEIDIPGNKWKSSSWLGLKAKLPKEQGGMGMTLSGLVSAIDDRFNGFSNFTAWMENKEKPDESWYEKVNNLNTPDDFIELFREIGIPGNKWKSGTWLLKAKLPKKKGGIGKNLSGLRAAIGRRFNGQPGFVAWMEGKDSPEATWVEKVNKCKTPQDFLTLFEQLGIPENKWKSGVWFQKMSKLPKEQGGIGSSMAGLYEAVADKFGGIRKFVAWMEGTPVRTIDSPEEAAEIIRNEATRLGVLTEDLLDPEKVSAYVRKSPVLKEALNYFAAK